MIKNILRKANIVSFFTVLFLLASCISYANGAPITWYNNYNEAAKAVKETQKPLFLYFSGSDWCSWCMKLDKEVLSSDEFITQAGNSFIFCKIDFPAYVVQNPEIAKAHEKLKNDFKAHSFPTIFLVDTTHALAYYDNPESAPKPFATIGYREGGGAQYANYVLELYKTHQKYEKQIKNLKKSSLSTLETCFHYAHQFKDPASEKKIICAALSQDSSSMFFLREYYRIQLQEGKINTKSALQTKDLLLSLDSDNAKHMHYDLAVLEFETLSKNNPMAKHADEIVKPLKEYLSKFGSEDEKNCWKVEVMISQTYANKNDMNQAINYALASQSHAPAAQRMNIAKNITEIQNQNEAIVEADQDEGDETPSK